MFGSLFDIIAYRIIFYVLGILFWGIAANGSLTYYAASSGATENDVYLFLSTLRFPPNFLIKLYFGNIEKDIPDLLKWSTKSGMMGRIVGEFFPVLFIIGNIRRFFVFPSTNEILVA